MEKRRRTVVMTMQGTVAAKTVEQGSVVVVMAMRRRCRVESGIIQPLTYRRGAARPLAHGGLRPPDRAGGVGSRVMSRSRKATLLRMLRMCRPSACPLTRLVAAPKVEFSERPTVV